MDCPVCGTPLDAETDVCATCTAEMHATDAAAPVNPAARFVLLGFGAMMALVFALVVVVAVLTPGPPISVPRGSGVTTGSAESTSVTGDPREPALAAAIRGFYATVDSGASVASSTYIYQEGLGGVAPAAVEASGTTGFRIARAVLGTGTADVYGAESRSVITTAGVEVHFRLRFVNDTWLISSWESAADDALLPQELALTESTALDIVDTVLQARQAGDKPTLTMLTTEAFQARHSSWFDGMDRSWLLLSWQIVAARPEGATYLVTATEQWLPTPITTTYTVVLVGGEMRVDAWTFQ